MDWLVDPFRLDLMRRALVAGLLVAVTTSLVGTWVVLRGMAFMGDALAHGVVPGLAAALLLGIHPVVGAFAAAAVMVGAIAAIHRATRLREDTAIGLLFVGMLALGVVVVSRSRSFAVDLVAILFGDVLGVSTGDVVASGVVAAATAVAVALLYRPLLVLSFNEEKAEVLSLHPRATHLALLVLVTLAIVSSFRTVGALLVFGLLIGPPATASLLTRRVPAMMAVAAAVGAASVVTGLVLGYHLDTAGGATMALVAISSFFVVLALRALRRGVDAAG